MERCIDANNLPRAGDPAFNFRKFSRSSRLAWVLLIGFACVAAQVDPATRGDAAWARRGEGEEAGRAVPDQILEAISAYEAALTASPHDSTTRWKLLRALHFAGDFTTASNADRLAYFDRAREVSGAGLGQLSRTGLSQNQLLGIDPDVLAARLEAANLQRNDVARLYFWTAINWAAWAREVGVIGAVRKGVANRLHDYVRVTLALEPDYDEGAAYRLLGGLHTELPRIPFFSSWVDRGEAIPTIERAYGLAPENPGNRLLLAVALIELAPERRQEAIGLLVQVQELTPRENLRIEDLAMREEAREHLSREAPELLARRG
jgi:tetratricopeptide (TPR) repeat protein